MPSNIQPEPPDRPPGEIRAGQPSEGRHEEPPVPYLGDYDFRKPEDGLGWAAWLWLGFIVICIVLIAISVLGGNANKVFSNVAG